MRLRFVTSCRKYIATAALAALAPGSTHASTASTAGDPLTCKAELTDIKRWMMRDAKPPKDVISLAVTPRFLQFWSNLQQLVCSPDLGLERVTELLEASATPRANHGRPEFDLHSKFEYVANGSYGEYIASDAEQHRFKGLTLEFDPKELCLSEVEIQRAFGPGLIAPAGVHPPTYLGPDQQGHHHMLMYSRPTMTFEIYPSGCASKMYYDQRLS